MIIMVGDIASVAGLISKPFFGALLLNQQVSVANDIR